LDSWSLQAVPAPPDNGAVLCIVNCPAAVRGSVSCTDLHTGMDRRRHVQVPRSPGVQRKIRCAPRVSASGNSPRGDSTGSAGGSLVFRASPNPKSRAPRSEPKTQVTARPSPAADAARGTRLAFDPKLWGSTAHRCRPEASAVRIVLSWTASDAHSRLRVPALCQPVALERRNSADHRRDWRTHCVDIIPR